MKVPTLQSNRVAAASGNLGYLQTPSNLGAGTEMLSRGISALGGAFSQYDAQLRARDEKTKDFNSITALNDFETQQIADQTELKRNSSPDGKDFKFNAETDFDKKAEEFLLKNIPADRQDAVRAQLSGTKQKLMLDAYKFQYEQGDAWYRQGLADQLEKARYAIDRDPSVLPEWQEKMSAAIEATDLSEAEKEELRDKVQISLVTTEYVKQKEAEALKQEQLGIGPIDDDFGGARNIIKKFESGKSATLSAYMDHDTQGNDAGYRVGHGSDTITREDGSHERVTSSSRVTQREADLDLEYRLREREGKTARDQLKGVWENLRPNVRAALYSVAYNYGNLPPTVVKAAREGTDADIANAVANLDANPGRRRQEAAVIRGESAIESDPKYDVIPFDDRVTLRNQAEQMAKQNYNAMLKEQEAVRIAQRNALQVGLLDGTMGARDIQKARDEGYLSDYDDIVKANKILADRQEQTGLSTAFTRDRIEGRPYDFTNEDQKKAYNAFHGKDGLDKVSSRDDTYFQQSVLFPFQTTGALAPDMAGLLQGMVLGANIQNKIWALDAMAQLRDTNEAGFNRQIPEAIQRQVDAFESMKGSTETPEQLADRIAGGTTQEERTRNDALQKKAEASLSKMNNGVPQIDTIMAELEGSYSTSFVGLGGGQHFYTNPGRAMAIETEFRREYIKEYGVYGDETKAKEAAFKTLKATWKVSAVGDGKTIMKYPPEAVGYEPSQGSYEWINDQIREEFKLVPGQKFELVSDDTTRQEWEKVRKGESTQMPSYRIMVQGADGAMRDATAEGTLQRISPKPVGNFEGMTEGNIDLYNRPKVKTPDGSIATVRSASFNIDGKEVLIPTVSKDGRLLTNEEALKEYKDTGEFLGKFDTPEQADKYAEALHLAQEKYYTQPTKTSGVPRIYFKKPEVLVAKERAEFDRLNELQKIDERLMDIVDMHQMNNAVNIGKKLPEGIIKEEEDLRRRKELLKNPVAEPVYPSIADELPPTDIMGN